jgi:hypothetical protein
MDIKETNNGKKGGLLKGKRHYDKDGKPLGGIKAVVTDTGKQVELEGGEVIINREASKKHWKTLSKINQSAGNGVPILPPAGATDTDPEEYKEGGNIIKFNPNHIPNKWILQYAKKIKSDHPKVWALGGNIFGNEAFENLKRVYERGYWLDSEEWMYIKWRSYVARHKKDFRIEGVIAMLKWVDKVDKGWDYMKQLIEAEIVKKDKKPFGRKAAEKMKQGGEVSSKVNESNFFDSTKAEFKAIAPKDCIEILDEYASYRRKKNKPEYINTKTFGDIKVVFESEKKNPFFASRSLSYYFVPKNGESVIRISDHWSKSKPAYSRSNKLNCSWIRSCYWENYGEKFEYRIPSQSYPSALIGGLCQFKDFEVLPKEEYKQGGEVTYKQKYNKRFDYDEDETHDLKEVAKDRGVSKKGLQKIYNKGVGAYKTNPESVRPSVKSKEQWAMGRVYSAVMGGKSAKIDAKELKMAKGGGLKDNCIEYINSHEAVLNNGYYCIFKNTDLYVGNNDKQVPHINSFCLVTYNSGGQKNLKVTDTINAFGLSPELQKLIGGEKGVSQVIIHEFIQKAKRLTKADLAEMAGGNIIIANRDTIECHSLPANKMAKGGLIAPNGQVSNLTPEQYKLVRTKAFKAWFGDWENSPETASKVVDENGEPLVVYRGSKSKNPNYIPHKHELSKGIYFSTKKQVAELYTTNVWQNWVGRVFDCFLNIRNIDVYNTLKLKSNIYQSEFNYYNDLVIEIKKNNFDGIRWDNFIDVPDLRTIFPNETIDYLATTFIVFEPEQIKLADGTNTTFDGSNPDIRYAEGGVITTTDNIKVEGFNNYQKTKKSGKFYKLFAQKNINNDEELWWILFTIKNGVKKIGTVRYRFENEKKGIYKENNISFDDLPNSLKEVYNNIPESYAEGGIAGDIFSVSDPDLFKQIITIYNGFENKFGINNYFIDHNDNSVVFLRGTNFSTEEIDLMTKEILRLKQNFDVLGNKKPHAWENNFKFYLNHSVKYKDGGLIAPNGKQSNLTPEQYKLVRTPEFKAWFGDWEKLLSIELKDSGIDEVTLKLLENGVSKVVDENGEPLVVYHGTKNRKKINVFDLEKGEKFKTDSGFHGKGFYFTPRKTYASGYAYNDQRGKDGLIYSCFLNVKKPFITTENKSEKTNDSDGVMVYYKESGLITHYGRLYEVMVINSNQIKLADGSNTTFDTSNPDIRYAEGGSVKDITCYKCGWSWDKKDSEKHDEYVCHKCGTDNKMAKGGGVKDNFAGVINGFYSPLIKVISESKQDKMPAKQWAEKFAKGDEAKWTGLTYWLAQQQGSVSKADILAYLKDNRISVVEVVKGGEQADDINNLPIEQQEEKFKEWVSNNYPNKYSDKQIQEKFGFGSDLYDEYYEYTEKEIPSENTKFAQYQLEGDKSNYKEVLVTLPSDEGKWNIRKDEYGIWVADGGEDGKVHIEGETRENVEYQIERYVKVIGSRANGKFQSSHFDEPNILVHLRMNTRTDAEGNKVLFLEEVQSDWGQKGKKEGFKETSFVVTSRSDFGLITDEFKTRKEAEDFVAKIGRENVSSAGIREIKNGAAPSAPFVTDTNAWVKLGLKVALKEAVAQGADKIAWTTGEQQNDRYDLAKTVSVILYNDNGRGGYDVFVKGLNGEKVYANENASLKDIEATLGKDIADKMANNAGDVELGDVKSLKGDNLKVGGKGMKGFYGSPTEGSLGILGNVAKSLFKQDVGTVTVNKVKGGNEKELVNDINKKIIEFNKLEGVDVSTNEEGSAIFSFRKVEFNGKEYYNGAIEKRNVSLNEMDGRARVLGGEIVEKINQVRGAAKEYTQHSITITPELIASVQQGLPMFILGGELDRKYLEEDPNYYTNLYEMESKMAFGGTLTEGLEGILRGKKTKEVTVVSVKKTIVYQDKATGKLIRVEREPFIQNFEQTTGVTQQQQNVIAETPIENIVETPQQIVQDFVVEQTVAQPAKEPELKQPKEKPKIVDKPIERLKEWSDFNMVSFVTLTEEELTNKTLADFAISLSIPTNTVSRSNSKYIFDIINDK